VANGGGGWFDVAYHDPRFLKAVSWGTIATGNTIAWIQSVNAGTVATLLTTVSLVLIGGVVKAIKEVGPAWEEYWAYRTRKRLELEVERDKFRRGSLGEQIERLKESLGEANEKLDDVKSQATEESKRHSGENRRLTRQLELAITQNEQILRDLEDTRKEKEELLVQMASVGQRVELHAVKIKQIESTSGSRDGE
jgi:hypothetical protein